MYFAKEKTPIRCKSQEASIIGKYKVVEDVFVVLGNHDVGNYDALKTLLESKDPLWKTQEILVGQRINIEIPANSGGIINENGSIH